MARKKTKVEGVIKNKETESAIDVILRDEDKVEDDVSVKTVEAHSKTKLEDDTGYGEAMTLRFFDFAANPETFKHHLPTAQELFNAHAKQIEVELWKDEWSPISEVLPRILFSKDKTHYRIVIAARPAKGSNISVMDKPQTLSEIANTKTNG